MKALRARNLAFFLFFLSLLTYLVSLRKRSVAIFVENHMSRSLRFALARVSSLFPVSLFEIFVILSPILIFLLVRYVNTKENFLRLLSCIALLGTVYIYTLAIPRGYGTRFSEYDRAPTEDELISAAQILISDVNENSRAEPVTLSYAAEKIREGYRKISHGYGVKYRNLQSPKPLITSKYTSYLGILALYAFPTSEICINLNIPRYLIPHTLAHEYSHMLGVSLEGEASFFAYLASIETGEPYIIYSASLSVLEYLFADIAKSDREMYTKLYKSLSHQAKLDIEEWRLYSQKYSRTQAYIISDKLNNSHEAILGGGSKYSYSAVSRYVSTYLTSS